MWKTESTSNYLKVCSISNFYTFINFRFNLASGNPRTDVSSFCEKCKHTIKSATDTNIILEIMTKLRKHKMNTNNFFELQEDIFPDTSRVSFDMRENQPFP